METALYTLLCILIGVMATAIGLLLWERSSATRAASPRPRPVYIQQEAPVQQVMYDARPRGWDTWWPVAKWPSTWWNSNNDSDGGPWNYRNSYSRLYDWGWPWRSRGSEEVHPSRWSDERERERPRRKPAASSTIHIQLPSPVNTVTNPTQAPPALPLRSPLPEPIPTIHSGPTAPPAAPPAPTAPVQVQTPEMFVPGSPPADKGYTLVTSFPDQEPLPLPTVS
jgi:hypothetical protein